LSNIENDVYQSYKIYELSYREIMEHGHTELMTRLFSQHILPIIEKEIHCFSKKEKTTYILEVGAGTCYPSYYIRIRKGRRGVGCLVIATDVSPYALKTAKKLSKYFGAKLDGLIACDCQYLPFKTDSFRTVHGIAFLHHIESPEKACREIYRVLRRGGRFLGMEGAVNYFMKFFVNKISGAEFRGRVEKVRENIYSFDEWKHVFEKAGFEYSFFIVNSPSVYKSLIGRKSKCRSYKGRYLLRYVYETILTIVPNVLITRCLGATLSISALKK